MAQLTRLLGMGTGGHPPRANRWLRSFSSRWVCLVFATVWGLLGMSVVLNLHENFDHEMNIEGQPVMHTVFGRDPGLWTANFLVIGTAIAICVIELAVRSHRRSAQPGVVAIVFGSLLCVYSLFGLFYGVAAIAPIGVLMILSGLPVEPQQEMVTRAPQAAP